MTQVITARFEDGVLKPDRKLNLIPGCKVQLVVTPWNEKDPVSATEAGSAQQTRDQVHELLQAEWENSFEQRQKAFEELERFRKQNPINSGGQRLTRDQLHERP